MRLTMNQIVMMNHAAWVNGKRTEAQVKAKTEGTTAQDEKDPVVYKGKRISELNSEETQAYLNS